MNKQLKDNWYS